MILEKKKIKSNILLVNDIRNLWFLFFEKNNYKLIDSSTLIPEEKDKSLLWINSGIAALKKLFFTDNSESFDLVNCQRSIRIEDLLNNEDNKLQKKENFYHHTLFEMLGIFSVNSNFKEETIPLIWDFFTSEKWLSINKNNLFITVWNNDDATINCWINIIGLDKKRIIYGNSKSNFWDMGNGPCGPNTEIYYDFYPHYPFPSNINDLENDRFVEICNIVFPDHYNSNDFYSKMDKYCVDTGVGLERIAMIIQKKKNTFEIDIWSSVIKLISKIFSEKKNIFRNLEKNSFYIIADHLRTVIFALADNAKFSSKGSGYILKKLFKIVVAECYFLNFDHIDLQLIIDELIKVNSVFYKHLFSKKNEIIKIILFEFKKYFKFLNKCELDLENIFDKKNKKISPEDIFFLYDTKGVPLKLIKKIFSIKKISFPNHDFYSLLNEQKKRSSENRENKDIKVF